jgi:hypothetical protein
VSQKLSGWKRIIIIPQKIPQKISAFLHGKTLRASDSRIIAGFLKIL